MTKMNDKQIAAYEAKGFNRWTKGSMDRLYINATDLGLEVEYYKTGNVSSAKWDGESISNADARRFLSSKVFVDINTGELHVQDRTTVDWHVFDQATLEDKAQALIDEIETELAEPEVTDEETTDETENAFETITEDAFGYADRYFDGNDRRALKSYYGADSAHGVVFKAWQRCKDAATRRMLVEEMAEIRNYRDAIDFIWGERDDAGIAWDAPISSAELIGVLYPVMD